MNAGKLSQEGKEDTPLHRHETVKKFLPLCLLFEETENKKKEVKGEMEKGNVSVLET